jgi:nucleotide-binding universal stress UspA family protein
MKQILVAVDGSKASEVSAQIAMDLCRLSGARLKVITTVEEQVASLSGYDDSPADVAQRSGEALVNEVVESALSAGLACESCIEQGNPVAVMLSHSDTSDLTVLGATGASSKEIALGHTASTVANDAIRPILVTRGTYRPIQKVLIAYNRTGGAAAAVAWVAQLAGKAGWQVTLVTGADTKTEGEQILAGAVAYLAGYGVEAEARVVIPADGTNAVFVVSREVKPDLILVGSRGRNSLTRALLGSTSQEVLEQVDCSVLVCH